LVAAQPFDANDQTSVHGWRLEKFVADEVLRCRQGRSFDGLQDENLNALLYQRSAPISAAVTITIDVGADG
jgi:thymidylate synthase